MRRGLSDKHCSRSSTWPELIETKSISGASCGGGKGQAGRGKSTGPWCHIKEDGFSPKGGGRFRRALSRGVVGIDVAVRDFHDGSQNSPHTTCSFYNVPLTLFRGKSGQACGCGRNGMVYDSQG